MSQFSRDFGFVVVIAGIVGCGGEPPPVTTTPEVTPEQKESMKKAMEGGGGPGMINKMQKDGKQKPG